jgi:hypothetical protein
MRGILAKLAEASGQGEHEQVRQYGEEIAENE